MFSRRNIRTAVILVIALGLFCPYLWSRLGSGVSRICVFEGKANESATQTDLLRVACYNIAHGRGLASSNWDAGGATERLKRLADIADLLKKIDADVVVLNEVDFDTSWSNNVNQAKWIAESAGFPYRVEERNLDFRVLHRTWRFGNAILSKYPIANSRVVDLPSFAGIETALAGKKRGVMCDVDVNGKSISVIGLHLSHRSEHVRELSARKVVDIVKANEFPCIVMGDMNSTPAGYPQSNLTRDGRNAIKTFDASGVLNRNRIVGEPSEAEFTFRSDDPKSIIDWIYVSAGVEIATYEVVDSELSDHRPVMAELDVFPSGSRE